MGKITESFSSNVHKDNIVKEFCGKCSRETRHMIVTSYEMNGEEDCGGGHTIDWYSSWQVIQCQGCEDLSFRKEDYFSEDAHIIGQDEWDDGTTITLYPKRTKFMRLAKEFINVPNQLRNIYIESIETFNNDSFILTAAGLRALVEGLCSNLRIKDGNVPEGDKQINRKTNLEGKIFGLRENGY